MLFLTHRDLFADFVLNDGDVFYVIAEFDTAEFYAEELGLDLYSSDSNNGIGSGKLFEVSDTGGILSGLVVWQIILVLSVTWSSLAN